MKKLTKEASEARLKFIEYYGKEGNCSCHLNPPCSSCIHEGNPLNQEEDETCWEETNEAEE